MRNILRFGNIFAALTALSMLCTTISSAQQGTLRGGNMVLSNGSNTVTIGLPGSPGTYTITLPVDTSNGVQYLFDDGTGVLNWGVPVSSTSTGTVLYNTAGPQTLTSLSTDLFNIGYNTSDSGPALGALINVVGNGGNSTTMSGLTDTARNLKASNVNAGNVTALVDTVGNSGSGTQIGLKVTMSGTGTKYAALTTGGNNGIGTGAPTEILEVTGNIRISGLKGLKITEWTDPGAGAATAGTMGKVTLAAGTKIVKTSSVTANSRIILTAQTGIAPGTLYVSARTAGTSFSITSTNALDASSVAWIIIEP